MQGGRLPEHLSLIDERRRLCTWQVARSGAWLQHTCRVRKVAQRSRALWGSSALSAGISRIGTWPWLPQCRRTQSPLNTTVLSWPGNPLWRLSPPGHPSGVGLSTRALAICPQHLASANSPWHWAWGPHPWLVAWGSAHLSGASCPRHPPLLSLL